MNTFLKSAGFLPSLYVIIVMLLANTYAQEVSIFTEATAGETMTNAELLTHSYDTTVRNDGAHTLTSGSDIEMSPGHHLVVYSSLFSASSGTFGRKEVESRLNLNGVDLSTGWSSSLIAIARDQNEAFTVGGAIIDVATAGDVLQLRTSRSDGYSGSSDTIERAPGQTGIQLLKLDDEWDYLRLDAAGADADQTLPADTTTWTPVAYDSELEKDGASFEFVASGADITLKEQGLYLIFANTGIDNQGTAAVDSIVQRLTLDGVEVTGSRTSVYVPDDGQGGGKGVAGLGMIIETTVASQILNVEILQNGGFAAVIEGERTGISIVRLPDNAQHIRLEDSSADQDLNPGVATTLVYDDANSQVEIDSDFNHSISTNPGRVGVNQNGDYLFFAQQYNDIAIGIKFGYYNQGWQVNGAGGYFPYGQTGRFFNSGFTGLEEFGNWSGFITGLNSADYVETLTRQLGNSGGQNASILSLQGLRIDNILGPDVYPPIIVNESPVDDSSGLYVATDLVLTFDENIALTGSGSITIVEDPSGSAISNTINLPDASVTVDGTNLLIDPNFIFANATEYSVQISNDALTDTSTENAGGPNAFPGISDNATWNFTTAAQDASAPVVTETSPVDNAAAVRVDSALLVTFDDPIFIGNGNIYIYNITDGVTAQTIDVTDSSQVSINNSVLTITPTMNLPSEADLAIRWDTGIVRNLSYLGNAAVTDSTTWNFTTSVAPLANSINIYNPGFEADAISDGGFVTNSPTNWSASGNVNGVGYWNPTDSDYSSEAPEGVNVAYIEPQNVGVEGGFSQIMADVYESINGSSDYPSNFEFIHGADYRLKARVGYPNFTDFGGYKIQLLAGGTVLAEDVNTQSVSAGSFVELVLDYNAVSANAALDGSRLEIRLLTNGASAGGGVFVEFDDVELSYSDLNLTDPYNSWSEGPFAGTLTDTNADLDFDSGGLSTGLEWVLGGDPTDPEDDLGIVPTYDNSSDPDYFIFTFRRADLADADINTYIAVEYGSSMNSWTTAVHDGTDIVITEIDDGAAAGIDTVEVKIRRTLAVGGKLFTRLNVNVTTP